MNPPTEYPPPSRHYSGKVRPPYSYSYWPKSREDRRLQFSVCKYNIVMHEGLRNLLLFVVLVVLYCLVLSLCALLMKSIEAPFEDEWRIRITQMKERLSARDCLDRADVEGYHILCPTGTRFESRLMRLFCCRIDSRG